jgi:predicted transcriptional regulator
LSPIVAACLHNATKNCKIFFCDYPSKVKTTPISIRLDPLQDHQLETLANRFKVSKAVIVGWAIDALAEYAAKQGGRLTLPIDFEELWECTQKTAFTYGTAESQKHKDGIAADFENLAPKTHRLNEPETPYPTRRTKNKAS